MKKKVNNCKTNKVRTIGNLKSNETLRNRPIEFTKNVLKPTLKICVLVSGRRIFTKFVSI